MHLARLRDHRRRRLHVPQPPTGDGEGLGERGTHQGPLRHPRQGREIGMPVRREDDVLVHLVGQDPHVELLRQRRQLPQFLASENAATRVRGIAEHERLQAPGEHPPQLRRIEAIIGRMQRHVHGLRPGQQRIRPVVFIKRREKAHPVARIAHGHHRHHHRLGRTTGDHQLGRRVHGPTGVPAHLLRQRLAQLGRTPRHRILVPARVHGRPPRRNQLRRRIPVGEALRQVDRPVPGGDPRHLADERLGKAGGAEGGAGHRAIQGIRRVVPTRRGVLARGSKAGFAATMSSIRTW